MDTALICGVDEAGRGPLAGPVYAAAVILDPDHPIEGLADSKVLTEPRRRRLADQIRAQSLAWSVALATVEEIDQLNILRASLLAMQRAVESLKIVPGQLLVDGLHCPKTTIAAQAIVGGDASVPEISAASILAKTERDAEMLRLHERYPQYGFAKHKGYPTREHLAALGSHGACIVHRRSFGPVRRILEQYE